MVLCWKCQSSTPGHPAEGGRGVAPAWKDLTPAPRLVLGVCRGAVGYEVGEEGRVLNVRAVDLDLTLKATDSYFEQESEIKKAILSGRIF